ncbi:MAG: Nif3-like dinuclear metal center hexameric protein [Oscillospiraceae bacterium]|nr:Nif3-like dinuclear metal center hexameric protein [Oscillospiraceae bacterium]
MPTVRDVYIFLDQIAPFAGQMPQDNSGLLVGDEGAGVRCALLALDITNEVIDQAAAQGAQLILSHHPVIYLPRKQLLANDPVYRLARAGIAAIAAHTSLDDAAGGVTEALAARLGVGGLEPVLNAGALPEPCLRMGTLPRPLPADEFARHAAKCLRAHVRYCAGGKAVQRIGLCGGGGAKDWIHAARAGADAYLTGDADHHNFIEAKQAGLSFFAAGHYETERLILPPLLEKLQGAFPAVEWRIAQEENPVMLAEESY